MLGARGGQWGDIAVRIENTFEMRCKPTYNAAVRNASPWLSLIGFVFITSGIELRAQASSPAPTPVVGNFKTVDGKEYKNATVTRVEPDGILLSTKAGISKVYFGELPKEVQERFQSPSPSRSDQVFLTERVPVRSHSSLVSFPPGTALHVISKNSDTSHVTDGTLTFDVPNNKLTTDANLAARLAQNENAATQAVAEASARGMEAYQQAQAAKRAEQQRNDAELRQAQQQQQAAE